MIIRWVPWKLCFSALLLSSAQKSMRNRSDSSLRLEHDVTTLLTKARNVA